MEEAKVIAVGVQLVLAISPRHLECWLQNQGRTRARGTSDNCWSSTLPGSLVTSLHRGLTIIRVFLSLGSDPRIFCWYIRVPGSAAVLRFRSDPHAVQRGGEPNQSPPRPVARSRSSLRRRRPMPSPDHSLRQPRVSKPTRCVVGLRVAIAALIGESNTQIGRHTHAAVWSPW